MWGTKPNPHHGSSADARAAVFGAFELGTLLGADGHEDGRRNTAPVAVPPNAKRYKKPWSRKEKERFSWGMYVGVAFVLVLIIGLVTGTTWAVNGQGGATGLREGLYKR